MASTLQKVGIGLGVAAVGAAGFVAALPWIVQPFLRLALFPRYDLRPIGLENLPRTGPVLLVANHITWYDGFFLAATLPRRGTALVNAGVFGLPVIGLLARRCGLLSIPYSGPKAQKAAITSARRALDEGALLGIFPEGQLTRTGMTGPFHRGLELILSGREGVPVVPVYIHNACGSLLSYSGGRFLRKRPQGWRRTVVLSFGPPVEPPVTAFAARQAVLVAGVMALAAFPDLSGPLETIDPALPHFEDPALGPLTGSAADEIRDDARQIGQKPGTVGHPLPGVAIRAVDEAGRSLPVDVDGDLEALVPGREAWTRLGRRGRVDRDGFIVLT